MSQDKPQGTNQMFPEQTYQCAPGDPLARPSMISNHMQYGPEANDMRYPGALGMDYSPEYGWSAYSGNMDYTSVPRCNVEVRGKIISKFAHKCEKSKA